jgi:hypothetical protein
MKRISDFLAGREGVRQTASLIRVSLYIPLKIAVPGRPTFQVNAFYLQPGAGTTRFDAMDRSGKKNEVRKKGGACPATRSFGEGDMIPRMKAVPSAWATRFCTTSRFTALE